MSSLARACLTFLAAVVFPSFDDAFFLGEQVIKRNFVSISVGPVALFAHRFFPPFSLNEGLRRSLDEFISETILTSRKLKRSDGGCGTNFVALTYFRAFVHFIKSRCD